MLVLCRRSPETQRLRQTHVERPGEQRGELRGQPQRRRTPVRRAADFRAARALRLGAHCNNTTSMLQAYLTYETEKLI